MDYLVIDDSSEESTDDSSKESFNTAPSPIYNPLASLQSTSTQHSSASHYHDDPESILGTDDDDDDSITDMEELDKLLLSDDECASTSLSDINLALGGVCSNQSSQHYSAEYGLQATVSNKTKPECNRNKNLMKDTSRVTPDSSEHKGAACKQDFDHQMQKCYTVLMDFRKILSAVEGVDEVHIKKWFDQCNDLLKQTDSNSNSLKTYIAVLGDTGAGKSSLLNALLDEEDLLPSCSMRACTASVVEVSFNSKNKKYEADVEFLTKQEWYTELEALIDDLRKKSGNLRNHCPDSDSEAAVAFSRVMAVYGKIAEVTELKQIDNVTKHLGKTKHITEEKVGEFSKKIERFIVSSVDSFKRLSGGEYWPIVKRVRLRVPGVDALRTGAVLVDLPGVKDSNPARDSVAKEYLKTCNAVWIVSDITRAVDDKTAKDILTKRLRTQLYMDGQYGSSAYICTKTDNYNVKEIRRTLHLQDKLKPQEEKNVELKKKIKDIKKQPDSQHKISELQNKIQENQQAIALECVKARNKFSKKQIRKNCRRGLQEMRRVSNKGIESDDDDDDDDDDSDGDDDDKSVAKDDSFSSAVSEKDRKMPVFSVSAKDYLKLRGKLETEGQPQVFNCVEDTEIPALKDFAIQTAMKKRKLAEKKVIRSVASFISDVVTYLMNHSSQDKDFHEQIREPVESCLSSVREMMQKVVTECSRNIKKRFSFLVKISLDGIKEAIKACEQTATSWGSLDETPGKYPYRTYKAVCVRQGVFTSGKYGSIDFNEELIEPILTTLQKHWNQFFSHDLHNYLNSFKNKVLKKLNKFFKNVMSKLCEMSQKTAAVEKIQSQQIKRVEMELSNFIMEMEAFVNQRQREISRLPPPAVQADMKSTYEACAEMRGQGCLQRMTTCMCDFIDSEKERMFNSVGDSLTRELKLLRNDIKDLLELVVKDLQISLNVQFEPLLKLMTRDNVPIRELELILEQVRKICQESNIQFKLKEGEESLPSTSGTAKRNTYTKEQHFHETSHKEKNTVAATPHLVSSVSSTPCKNTYSKSIDMTVNLSGRKRRPDDMQTPAVSSKIKITLQDQQQTVLETCTTICSSEDQQEANSSGGQPSSQSDMHPTSTTAMPPHKMSAHPKRQDKFSPAENKILLNAVQCHYREMFGRTVNQEDKNRIWQTVVNNVNTAGGPERTIKACRRRVSDMIYKAKKKAKTIEAVRENAGSSVMTLNDTEKFLLSLGSHKDEDSSRDCI